MYIYKYIGEWKSFVNNRSQDHQLRIILHSQRVWCESGISTDQPPVA